MNKNLTEIIIVSDRSGSMQSCRSDAEGGINQFIVGQQALPGEARLTFVQFDTVYEVLHDAKPIKAVGPYTLIPRGGTAMLDAIGKAVATVGERLLKTSETDRPGLVVCVISTDGEENSSREYSAAQIAAMIKCQTEQYSWQFQFLGANLNVVATCQELEIKTSGGIQLAADKIGAGYRSSSGKVGAMRGATSRGVSGQAISDLNAYTEDERKELGK